MPTPRLDVILEAAGLEVTGRARASSLADEDRGRLACPGPIAVLSLRDEDGRSEVPATAMRAAVPLMAIRLQRRAELDQLIDVLDDDRARGPRRLTLVALPGSGVRTLFAAFAREARLRGFVPVGGSGLSSTPFDPSAVERVLARRHVVVLDDRRGLATRSSASALLARLGPGEGRPHLVVSAVSSAPDDAAMRLRPLDAGRPPSRGRLHRCAHGRKSTRPSNARFGRRVDGRGRSSARSPSRSASTRRPTR